MNKDSKMKKIMMKLKFRIYACMEYLKLLLLSVNYSYKMSVYYYMYYACTCTFDYELFIPLCYTGAMCRDMKCVLKCFTRDESGNNINCSHPVINFAIFPAIQL